MSGRAEAASGDERPASDIVGEMTQAEKLALVHGPLAAPWGGHPKPAGAIGSAGFIPGAPRLGVPPLQETDAELGVANPGGIRKGDTATAMPSNLAMASSFDEALAFRQGEAVGAEAAAKGFNLLMGGAANLVRDPRGGRDFEFFSEDPLLTGVMAGAEIAGVQSRHVITTLKHFALNDQETDRVVLNVEIDRAAARESDLLAFELALERGRPGAVMCAYNQVNGAYSCENDWLLNWVLKRDWRFPGFVMSDWGAVHSTVKSAMAGLDQESGEQLDTETFFGAALASALSRGEVPPARLDDMAKRIVDTLYRIAPPRSSPPERFDAAESEAVALQIAREGIVLLKNGGILPLGPHVRKIAVIGAHADAGVPAGGGSSEVTPRGGVAARAPAGPDKTENFDPSSPLAALRRRFPAAEVAYDRGDDLARAAAAAGRAEVAIVFADKWMTETADAPDLNLPRGQDRLIETVAAAQPHTIVVLETGGPVATPWLARVKGVMEAWYSGQRGGEAIAEALSGDVDPSGRLPVSFPQSERQLPHPKVQGDPAGAPPGPVGRGGHYGRIYVARYDEGADVGYKWLHRQGEQAAFPFGFGLSYTAFSIRDFAVRGDSEQVVARVRVRNEGAREGVAVPQVYLQQGPGAKLPLRLLGWARMDLQPGEEKEIELAVNRRLLASFDEAGDVWRIAPGDFQLSAGFDADHPDRFAHLALPAVELAP